MTVVHICFFVTFAFHFSKAQGFEVEFPYVLEAAVEVCSPEDPDGVVDECCGVSPEGFDEFWAVNGSFGEIHAGGGGGLDFGGGKEW